MDIKRALPRPELRSVVRSFEERRADLGSAVLTWPVAARPHQILDVTRRKFGIITASIPLAVADARTGAMGMSTNLERFKAIVERGFSQGDLTVADEVCGEQLIEHEYLARTDIPGPQILKAQIEDARHSIKELKLTVEAIVETSDTVWARSKATGVDPRSGKPVTIDVVDICRFADGKLVEHWGCQTDLPFFTRLELCRLRPNECNAGVRPWRISDFTCHTS